MNKAVFLDRDNTIIEDPGYISSPDQVRLLPGAADAIKDLSRLGYKAIVITNQSAVARGMITEETLALIHQRLERLLSEKGAYIEAIYYCPYHPDGIVAQYKKESGHRKPNPGMILQAAQEHSISLEDSWMIGDSYRDIAAGKSANCRTILINSPVKPPLKKPQDPLPDYEAVNIRESANIIKMFHRKNSASPYQAQKPSSPENTDANNPISKRPANVNRDAQTVIQSDKDHNQLDTSSIDLNRHNRTVPAGQTVPGFAEDTEGKTRKMRINNQIERNQSQPTETPFVNPGSSDSNHLLRDILYHLKHQKDYEEFSLTKLLAGIVQAAVIFCLILAVWIMIGHSKTELSVFKPLAFAAVLQMTSLTLYVMDNKK